jgi:hypothetical protein
LDVRAAEKVAGFVVYGNPARCRRCAPTNPLTIVPLAIALATLMQSAESAVLLAANIGGDSESVGSIAGSAL